MGILDVPLKIERDTWGGGAWGRVNIIGQGRYLQLTPKEGEKEKSLEKVLSEEDTTTSTGRDDARERERS